MLIKIQDVIVLTSLSRATIYRMMAEGEFPRSAKISKNRIAWEEAAINKWVKQKFSH